MIEISRALARRLRVVFRKAVPASRMRGRRPPLSLHADRDGLCVRSHHPEVVVAFHRPGPCPPEEIILPGEALDDFEGRGDVPVTLQTTGPETVRACWDDAGVPQVRDFRAVEKDKLPPFPEEPNKLIPVESALLRALDDAVGSATRDDTRFALTRIQLRGRKGELIATDGRQLLMQKGFTFPWEEDVLVPALDVFGCKELAQEERLLIGKTDGHVCLRVGPWTFHLAVDKGGRFPDADGVVPRLSGTVTVCRLSPEDAAFLTQTLPRLPGKGGDHEPVTLDLNGCVAVRARAEGQDHATELVLSRSTASGPAVRLVCNRLYLRRAVHLGFRAFHVVSPSAPVVCQDGRRTYLWMPLDQEGALPPGGDDRRISSTGDPLRPSAPSPLPAPEPEAHKERRRVAVPRPDEHTNGPQANGHADSGAGLDELIQEAEDLRTSLLELCGRLAHLGAQLKRHRKRGRAVEAALAALRLKLPALP